MLFQDLNLIEPILKALKTEGYTTPTPIQQQSIPIILQRKDLLGCAQTGTGKTAAFSIPILQILHEERTQHKEPKAIKALILTPTRELAIQIGESIAAYGRHTGLKHLVIFGGVSQNPQVDALRRGVDILVATPGRLLDLMNQRYVHLDHVKLLVLDEADRMLDMGFVHDVKKIIAKVPSKRQTLFFSATMPKEIQTLADTILNKPEKVEVTPVSSTADTINQSIFFVDKGDKRSLLSHILKDKEIKRVLVFTRTKHGADKVVKDLNRTGVTAEAIHGNKSQNARQRALTNFKNSATRVLVATDIAARGIDVDDLTHVIQYELPEVPETYVHRIGRTGRAGANGIAFSFCDEEEKDLLKDIHKTIGKTIPVDETHPYPLKGGTLQDRIRQDLKKNPTHQKPSSSERNRNRGRRPSGGGGGRSSGANRNANAGGNRTGGGERNSGGRR
ncbi:DEAD/DEAH box helicase [Mucilaginibacter agri]|uniref:DEAD-box ATP-dependent RNA helicase RhpA n=1 Tax=Mucilaginibacter agri TaxID=2695265 RepID=A0A965ZID2_9SPHI|nr:DEAD/DEAH box helicase [Mucilaginibacter agri]NCD70693.1 DEAD/DEAH box helicase [Mucilaginibacter agri]